jgi:fructose-specific phosphotransferase system IIC component
VNGRRSNQSILLHLSVSAEGIGAIEATVVTGAIVETEGSAAIAMSGATEVVPAVVVGEMIVGAIVAEADQGPVARVL